MGNSSELGHSYGYEMRLQTARELRKEAEAKARAINSKKFLVEITRDALNRALRAVDDLPRLLAAYEATGDHDHSMAGNRPVSPGAACPGGDCLVADARKILAALARGGN